MPLPPELQSIIQAVGQGEYDRYLYHLDKAIHQRRDEFDRHGLVQPSPGDWVEIWSEPQVNGVMVPKALLGQELRVVGYTTDDRLRCRVEAPISTEERMYWRGVILKVSRDWVYRVHYAP